MYDDSKYSYYSNDAARERNLIKHKITKANFQILLELN